MILPIRRRILAMVRRLVRVLAFVIQGIPTWVLSVLDWVINVAERLVVIAIVAGIGYIGWRAFYSADQAKFIADTLEPLSKNWKGLLLLLIPLFYRTARTFLEKVKKVGWMETEPREKPEAEQGEGE